MVYEVLTYCQSYSYRFTGGDIAKVICQAAESCALLGTPNPTIDHDRLIQAAESELKRKQENSGFVPNLYE